MHLVATFSSMVDGAVVAAQAGTATDRIVFLGHATVLIELEGVRLLTDPVLRGRVAHLRRQVPPVDESALADLDAVLISHSHHDHLDLASLRLLGPDTPLIVPAGVGTWLRKRGLSTVIELSVGETVKVGEVVPGTGRPAAVESSAGNPERAAKVEPHAANPTGLAALTVTAVHAEHDGHRPGGPRAETLGYLVSGRRVVYFAGDTALYEEMSNIAPSLDVALVPVAGWGPKLGPGHMDPLDAARAVSLLRPRLAIPVHWGTLSPIGVAHRHKLRLGEPPRLFAEHARRLAPQVEVRILTPGEQTAL
jgi:L-ascorbate metabolism protein UlaG (beta-lactamase superfamily)